MRERDNAADSFIKIRADLCAAFCFFFYYYVRLDEFVYLTDAATATARDADTQSQIL